jgi:uncharacterized protein YjbI with pentapeptide repeats
LYLQDEDLVDDAKLAHLIEKNESVAEERPMEGGPRWVPILSLAGRDLTAANLANADVRHIDFRGAILNRANLVFAWANDASFEHAQLRGASLAAAQLQGASFFHAQLQGASLPYAKLQGASLGAQLQVAYLVNAELQGAWLAGVQLHAAFLNNAQLQAAYLNGAHFEGASLEGAQLQGASLDSAQLQGTSLNLTNLEAAFFKNVYVWRADSRSAHWKDTRVEQLQTEQKLGCLVLMKPTSCQWTTDTFEILKKMLVQQLPDGNLQQSAMERIEPRLDLNKVLDGEIEMAQVWAEIARGSPTQEDYEKSLAQQWAKTGCSNSGAPYVVRSLLSRLTKARNLGVKEFTYMLDDTIFSLSSQFDFRSPEMPKLAATFLDTEHCPGARGLSQAEIAKLKEIAAQAPPPAPKH